MSRDIKINHHDPAECRPLVEAMYNDLTALAAKLNGMNAKAAILTIGTTTSQYAHLAFSFSIAGVEYTIPADATLAFTTADTINDDDTAGLWWGAWLIQVTAAKAVTSISVSSDQAYATEAAAIAALPDPDADNVVVGYITVQTKTGADWDMKTDDLTAASDCQLAYFYTGSPESNNLITLETLNE